MAPLGYRWEEVEDGIQASRYERQIQKDLTAGPSQYGVTRSPFLHINSMTIEGPFGVEELAGHIEKAVMDMAF